MNHKQFGAVIEYFMSISQFNDEDERQENAEAGADAIDEILKANADE